MGREAQALGWPSLHSGIALISFKSKMLFSVGSSCFSQLEELKTTENHQHTFSLSLEDARKFPHTHI